MGWGNPIIAVFRTPFAPWLQFHQSAPFSAWLGTVLTLLPASPSQDRSLRNKEKSTTVCPPCDNELKSEAIIEHLCASEFALRMKIKEVKKENGDKKIVPKKKKPLKLGPIKKKDLKKLVLYLKNGADCPCHQLDNLSHHFLIMGRKVKSQYLLTAIHKWDKKTKSSKLHEEDENHECPTFQSVFK
uniref:Secreted frizzled-related protein 1 n=1 Tax=Rhinopithecus bieti TaxID=61621 RepID=A0A2K6KZ99_RHIBE